MAAVVLILLAIGGAGESAQEGRAGPPTELRLPAFGRVERCPACHTGLVQPSSATAAHPLRAHPGRLLQHHPMERFGCTVCHRGRGEAATLPQAHGDKRDGSRLLAREHQEAACGQCHLGEIPGPFKVPGRHAAGKLSGAPVLALGRALARQAGCSGCHEMGPGWPDEPTGPDLTRLTSKVRFPWLVRWIERPRSQAPRPFCPTFGFTRGQAEAIGAALWSQSQAVPVSLPATITRQGDPERGKALFRQARCVSCHALEGKGGDLGPDLGRVGDKLTPAWLHAWVAEPRQILPGARCPRFRFTDGERADLITYLLDELRDPEQPVPAPARPPVLDPGQITQGRLLVREAGCPGCHRVPGEPGRVKVGPPLVGIGARPAAGRAAPAAAGTLAGWLLDVLKAPAAFRPGHRMPEYGFTDEEASALVTLLLGMTGEPVPGALVVPASRPAPPALPGTLGRLAEELNCLVCHTIRGFGGDVGPDLSWEGDRVHREWLVGFLRDPGLIRPDFLERMPWFKLSQAEAEALADDILAALRDPRIPAHLFPAQADLARWIDRGKALYRERGCHACHEIGQQGGTIGPSLAEAGTRLRPEWVYIWLKDPQAFITETKMPHPGLSDDQARALAAYVTSLR
ncbi:MAG: c-type cytochrome [Deltaproteobacteria bacterium]|nr:c-type cytochrome [Deltaproteobacteria bacterium]